jgi:hypothetical protein
MSEVLSQGDFNVTRLLDGSLRFSCPPVFVVAPNVALQIITAIVDQLGGELLFADPGQTVIRPPTKAGNGNGGLIR